MPKRPSSTTSEKASLLMVRLDDEQLAFWRALNAPPKLTPAQKRPGVIMRGVN